VLEIVLFFFVFLGQSGSVLCFKSFHKLVAYVV